MTVKPELMFNPVLRVLVQNLQGFIAFHKAHPKRPVQPYDLELVEAAINHLVTYDDKYFSPPDD